MKELSLSTLIAVFEEMFGAWLLWGLVALALAITVAFVVVLVRERRLQARRLIVSEVIAIAGGMQGMMLELHVEILLEKPFQPSILGFRLRSRLRQRPSDEDQEQCET